MKSLDNFDIITQNITIDDLPEDLKFIAEFCGMEVSLSLIKHASGMNLNIPKNCLNALIKSYIIRHYNGTRANILEISSICDVTERYIRIVMKEHLKCAAKNKSEVQAA